MTPTSDELPAEIYKLAVEQAEIAIAITDSSANILYSNAAFTRTTGFPPEAVRGRNQSIVSNKTTPGELYESLWRHLVRGQPWHGRLLNRRQDGTPYLAELAITPVQGAAGAVTHYLGMHRDVTAMHQLERRSLNQKRLIESVVDAAPMAIALLDASGKVILDNQAYKKLVTDLGTREPANLLLEALGKTGVPCRDGGVDVRIDRVGRRRTRWFCCSTQTIEICDESADGFFTDQHKQALLLIASDVTALYEEQEKARSAAMKSILAEEEHAATLREGMSAILFRIEEPINLMASAVALMRGRGDAGIAMALDQALTEARSRMAQLREMLPPDRHDNEAAIGVNLNEVVRDVLAIVTSRLLASGVTVDWRPTPVLPPVLGHPIRLRNAVKSLIDNAIDAIVGVRDGGPAQRREIALNTRAHRGGVTLVIDDSGPGIPPELRLRVFEPLFSAKDPAGQHLGTGLARAQQIVAEHGGVIDIGDATQGGCRIVIDLPVERGKR